MLSDDLKSEIEQYVNSVITLAEFEDWLIPRLRNYLKNQGTTDCNAISAIELGLAEISNGIRSEEMFRADLRNVIRNPITEVAFNIRPSSNMSSSTNKTDEMRAVGVWRTPIPDHR